MYTFVKPSNSITSNEMDVLENLIRLDRYSFNLKVLAFRDLAGKKLDDVLRESMKIDSFIRDVSRLHGIPLDQQTVAFDMKLDMVVHVFAFKESVSLEFNNIKRVRESAQRRMHQDGDKIFIGNRYILSHRDDDKTIKTTKEYEEDQY